MGVRYHFDPDTGLPHIYGHGVSEAEVEHVLRHSGEDRSGRDASRHALGQTAARRYSHVIYVPDEEDDGVFVVTAYEFRGKALQAYRRRRRR
jgi:hypothetical protein